MSLLIVAVIASAQAAPVGGDAVAGLVSRTTTGEVHLLTEPRLNGRRLVLKLVALNRTTTPQPLSPLSVTVAADGEPVAIATRDQLLGGAAASRGGVGTDPSQSRATAAMPVNGAGQMDVTGYTGGAGGMTGGVPSDNLDRASRGAAGADAAALDAALLKAMTIAPGGADGGALLTEKLKGKVRQVTVTVAFAGDTHTFTVAVPK